MPSLWSGTYTNMRETARLRKLLAELGTDNVKSEATTDNNNQQPTPDFRHPKTRNQQQTKIHFITHVYTEFNGALILYFFGISTGITRRMIDIGKKITF
jgi:hypothetical protein